LRRQVFHDPLTERNRVWQTDFSEFETTGGGIWRICAVIDYATKYCVAVTVTPTSRGSDALACLHAAVAEATRLAGLADLRDDRASMLVPNSVGVIVGQAPVPVGQRAMLSQRNLRPSLHRARPAAASRAYPGALAPDQRSRGAILRHPEV